jgi:hypothetical protein
MSIGTLLRYLFLFDRQAILEIAGDRRALFTGFLFVLSAGFAREYDGEDLLHEPYYLLIPVAASLAASFALYTLLCAMMAFSRWRRRAEPDEEKRPKVPAFWSGYRSFLTLFWMTAPLAWAYAVPYERFLHPGHAMQANLNTLGVVSVWRVLLMIRVAVVLCGMHWFTAPALIAGFGNLVLFGVLALTPVPILDIMSGARTLSPQDHVLAIAHFNAQIMGMCAAVVLVPLMLVAMLLDRPSWQLPAAPETPVLRPAGTARLLAWASLLFWIPLLPQPQREQQLRYQVENRFRHGRILEALDLLSEHTLDEFPPGWEPPPNGRRWFRLTRDVVEVHEALLQRPQAEWVQRFYRKKLKVFLMRWSYHTHTEKDRQRLAGLIKKMPDGFALLDEIVREDDGNEHRFIELVPEWKEQQLMKPK